MLFTADSISPIFAPAGVKKVEDFAVCASLKGIKCSVAPIPTKKAMSVLVCADHLVIILYYTLVNSCCKTMGICLI